MFICKSLSNFTCLTMKFLDCHHANDLLFNLCFYQLYQGHGNPLLKYLKPFEIEDTGEFFCEMNKKNHSYPTSSKTQKSKLSKFMQFLNAIILKVLEFLRFYIFSILKDFLKFVFHKSFIVFRIFRALEFLFLIF